VAPYAVTVQNRLDASLKGTVEPLAPPPAGLRVDGDLAEWQSRTPFVLDQRQSLLPVDPGIGWDGPQDLSVRAWLASDAEALTFAAEVTDDVHAAPAADGNGYWGSDSVQLAVDPRNDGGVGYDADDREVGLVLGAGGPRAHLSLPGPAVALLQAQVAGRRAGTRTIYEARIPWTALRPPPPIAGQVMAIDFIVNENDGQGRSCWMGLTPGIGEGKSPGSFRRFAVAAP